MVQGVTKGVTDLGLSMIAEEWEGYDEVLWIRKDLRPEWHNRRGGENAALTEDVVSKETVIQFTLSLKLKIIDKKRQLL